MPAFTANPSQKPPAPGLVFLPCCRCGELRQKQRNEIMKQLIWLVKRWVKIFCRSPNNLPLTNRLDSPLLPALHLACRALNHNTTSGHRAQPESCASRLESDLFASCLRASELESD